MCNGSHYVFRKFRSASLFSSLIITIKYLGVFMINNVTCMWEATWESVVFHVSMWP